MAGQIGNRRNHAEFRSGPHDPVQGIFVGTYAGCQFRGRPRAVAQLIGHAQVTEGVERTRWRWISELSQASGLRRESWVEVIAFHAMTWVSFAHKSIMARCGVFSPWLSRRELAAAHKSARGDIMSATPDDTRDRLAVHLVWEGILLIIAAALIGAALATTHGAHFGDVVRPAGYIGLIAAGLALSLRTATPNLAVGSIAIATGVLGAHLATADRWSLWAAMTLAVAIAAVTGFVAGLLVAGLSVPAWAVTLAVAIFAQGAAAGISNGQAVALHIGGSYPTALWLAVFAAVSIGGGVLWLIPSVRTTFSATRTAAEPGQWAGLPAGLGAVVGLTGSSLLAGVGGVSLASYVLVADPSSAGINLTIVALAAALFGGVSVFGRRAGLFGTVLAVLIAQAILFLMETHLTSLYWFYVPLAGLAVLGLGVSRVLESITDAVTRPSAP